MKIVCLDAGHGGKDPGTSCAGVLEKDVTLAFVQLLKAELSGFTVVCTRNSDAYVYLEDRAAFANGLKASLFVSIHCNGATQPAANGIEIFTSKAQTAGSVKAAKAMYSKALKASGFRDRGIKAANFAVLRETSMPAVLIELGFISNPGDRKQLQSADWRKRVAAAMAAGIREALS